MGTALEVVTVNFQLAELPDPDDRYSNLVGHRDMPMPHEGQTVEVDGRRYRIARLETHRVPLLHPPWVVLINVATVETG